MNALTQVSNSQRIHPGTLMLGWGRGKGFSSGEKLVLTCRKGGFDFLGQIKLNLPKEELSLEVFNESYFDLFESDKDEVIAALEAKVLSLLKNNKDLPDDVRNFARERLKHQEEDRSVEAEVEVDSEEKDEKDEKDLHVLFDQLNQEYFKGALKADIDWGKERKSPSRRSFRFGSYDSKKNLITVHPRLKQGFVPLCVLELTIYHEMCHQYLPPFKRNGQWQTHHREFKKKEREYQHYREAIKWEKKYWAKLLAPSSDE